MAPSSSHAVTTVISTQVWSHDRKSIVVEAGGIRPMEWFLRNAPLGEEQEDDAPPKKRRKTGAELKLRQQPALPATIPLARATLDLHFVETRHATSATLAAIEAGVNFDESASVVVNVEEIEQDEHGVRFTLVAPAQKGSVLKMDTTRVDEDLVEELQAILDIARGKRASAGSASSLVCTLSQSAGEQYTVVRLQVSQLWYDGISAFPSGRPVGRARIYPDYDILSRIYPDTTRETVDHSKPWHPSDFYDSVHVPKASNDAQPSRVKSVLDTELYPFQKRAVDWMLAREGVQYTASDGLNHLSLEDRKRMEVPFWQETRDVDGTVGFVNHLTGTIARTKPQNDSQILSGGLLAEEMGLGKTVELLALVVSHPRIDANENKHMEYAADAPVKPSRATLIITPSSILQQWRSELNIHAPHLKVKHYEGIPAANKQSKDERKVIEELCSNYDVVLATYNVLGREVYFAEDPPDRDMRHNRKYERKRSPLVQIQWWRVCLDEAQMVESGVSAAARVACKLPRVHSWAVTGTPLRKNAEDLHGLLIFLRFRPLDGDAKLWAHLIRNHRHIFRRIFGKIALRHTKAQIREELHLPPQKRVVITVPFTAVEQQQYQDRFDEMCEDVGLNSDGSPKDDEWDPDNAVTVEKMRSWLRRLRQTCLHPQVGGRNKKTLGRGQGPLRTVAEVLEAMIDINETKTRTEERALIASHLLRGHILGNNREDDRRADAAFNVYKQALDGSAKLVIEARERLETARRNRIQNGANGDMAVDSTDDEADNSSEGAPLLGRLRNNLRTALQLQHVCIFFTATACYQIKSNEILVQPESEQFEVLEKQETALYDEAKVLRQEILQDASRKASKLMRTLDARDTKKSPLPEIEDLESYGGIENRKILDRADALFDVIREQGTVIASWRAKMAEFLLKPLVDTDDDKEITGEEYEQSTKEQDELYAYFDAMKAIAADLNTFITGEDAPLIDHEVKMLLSQARTKLDPDKPDDFTGECHAPEKLIELFALRNKFRAKKVEVGSVRGLIQEARAMDTSLQWSASNSRSGVEQSIVQRHLAALNHVFTTYTKALATLEKEVDLFRSTQNQRLEFYRQLQELSDAVAPYKEELDPQLDTIALAAATEKAEVQNKALRALRSRYNQFLDMRGHNSSKSVSDPCLICTDRFEVGVLTSCGHEFCKNCIHQWWQQHRTCPTCRSRLSLADFTNITYKPRVLAAKEEVQASSSLPTTASASSSLAQHGSIYTGVDNQLLDEIKAFDLATSYGTKIDTLARHMHWIREHDPGAKAIVFSQYREFLDVLASAFNDFKIGCARLGRSGAVEKFKHDPSVDCLLLDAKTDSSGLTLVNATHVFICEPLIQTAVELQAIARVHRIGQTRQTTVWMYLINDTVEEAIYDISVARRLAHVRSRQQVRRREKSRSTTPAPFQENALDAANSEQLQSTPLSKLLAAERGGGEVVNKDDLWQCLFGKAQKKYASLSLPVEMEAEVGRFLRAEAADKRADTAA